MKAPVIVRGLIMVAVVVVAITMVIDTAASAAHSLLDAPWMLVMVPDTPRTNTVDWAIQWMMENGAPSSKI